MSSTDPSPARIRLLIADDSMFMRMAIGAICEMHEEIEIVGEAENGAEAVELAQALQPDIITMDLDMPEMDGLTATARIRSDAATRIIVLSSLSEHGGELSRRALEAGAVECLCKSDSALDVDLGTVAQRMVERILHWAAQPAPPPLAAGLAGPG